MLVAVFMVEADAAKLLVAWRIQRQAKPANRKKTPACAQRISIRMTALGFEIRFGDRLRNTPALLG
jgi:hypothetical protein